MLAVSLRQPVPDLLVTGVADAFEGYARASLRGRIAVHAGLGSDDAGWMAQLWSRAPVEAQTAAQLAQHLASCGHPTGAQVDGCDICARFGAVVGSVEIVELHRSCDGCSPWVASEKPHWRVQAPEPCLPMAWRGEPHPFMVPYPDD